MCTRCRTSNVPEITLNPNLNHYCWQMKLCTSHYIVWQSHKWMKSTNKKLRNLESIHRPRRRPWFSFSLFFVRLISHEAIHVLCIALKWIEVHGMRMDYLHESVSDWHDFMCHLDCDNLISHVVGRTWLTLIDWFESLNG